MVIYLEGTPRAIYFDSEGHVIRYKISFPADESVVFESDWHAAGAKVPVELLDREGLVERQV